MRQVVSAALAGICMAGYGFAAQTSTTAVPVITTASGPAQASEPSPPFGAGALRPDDTMKGVVLPVVLTWREPQYTRAGMVLKLQGNVEVEMVVNADGTTGDARVTKGLDARLPDMIADLKGRTDEHSLAVLNIVGNGPLGLDANAIQCVKTWTFTPGTILGTPRAMILTVSVPFRLH